MTNDPDLLPAMIFEPPLITAVDPKFKTETCAVGNPLVPKGYVVRILFVVFNTHCCAREKSTAANARSSQSEALSLSLSPDLNNKALSKTPLFA